MLARRRLRLLPVGVCGDLVPKATGPGRPEPGLLGHGRRSSGVHAREGVSNVIVIASSYLVRGPTLLNVLRRAWEMQGWLEIWSTGAPWLSLPLACCSSSSVMGTAGLNGVIFFRNLLCRCVAALLPWIRTM